jgi:uncharacterized Rmd1/YagE family protein
MQQKILRVVAPNTRLSVLAEPSITARGFLLGERIDTRKLERSNTTTQAPVVMRSGENGIAFVLRYGTAVLFNIGEAEERELLNALQPHTSDPLTAPESEQAQILIRPEADESIDGSGAVVLKDGSPERLQVVAHILSKNLILAHYEAQIAGVFDQIEPLAQRLHWRGGFGPNAKQLLRQIGYVLITQHRMVGRVEVEEKPEVLWDHPELERLYVRLENEYELTERSRAIERKLQLVNNTVATLLDLVQDARSIRLEYYVIVLILVEILLSAYDVLLRFMR